VLPDLDEHRTYLRDRHRLAAYARALNDVVPAGAVVVDVASGPGILGLLACRAGASRVYAIEQGPIAGLARRIADANGFGGRVSIVRDHSRLAHLPERADVVVCDQIGGFGVDAGILEIAQEARSRFLKPGGVLVPRAVEMFLAPIEHPRGRVRRRFWRSRPAQLDCAAAAEIAENSFYRVRLDAGQLLAAPARGATVDLMAGPALPLHITVETRVSRDGMLDGLGGWFAAALSEQASMTNSPQAQDRIRRRQLFFPIAEPVAVTAGTAIEASVQMLAEEIFAWQVSVVPERGEPKTFLHTTVRGMLLTKEDLKRGDPKSQPVLNPAGAALLTVMTLCDGRRSLADIEAEVFRRHPDLFASAKEATAFVAGVLARNSRP
jgi:protein arginine N-methyltransferase 1